MHLAAPSTVLAAEDIVQFRRRLSRLSLAMLIAALGVAVYAIIERRGLVADGAHYLLAVLSNESFDLSEPVRRVIMALLQGPTLLGIRLGLLDRDGATLVFCATLELVPLAVLVSCYFALPPERRHFFYFPLLHFLAGTLSASATPIIEGLTAVAYFWLLFCLVLFRPLGKRGFALVAVLSLPALFMSETMAGLGLVLAAAAGWRALSAPLAWQRWAFAALAIWYVAVGAVAIGYILVPNRPVQRENVLLGLFGGWWLLGHNTAINFPAWFALAGLLAVNLSSLLPMRGARERRFAWVLVGIFAMLVLGGVVTTALVPRTVFPFQQFAARLNPAMVSLIVVPGVVIGLWQPRRQRLWMRSSVLAVCGVLAAGCLAWQTLMVHYWSVYAAALRGVLANSRGALMPAEVEARLTPRERVIFDRYLWDWASPALSIMLAPGGRASALIMPANGWRVWNPGDPGQVPRSRFFDASPYRAAIAGNPPRIRPAAR